MMKFLRGKLWKLEDDYTPHELSQREEKGSYTCNPSLRDSSPLWVGAMTEQDIERVAETWQEERIIEMIGEKK